MTITFTSNTKNLDKKNKIEFTAPVTISEMEEFKVYEFIEPQNNVANRIEVSHNAVNIFAGPSSIILILDELIKNEYQSPQGPIFFDSNMKELVSSENEVYFEYTLEQANKIFGEFKIKLSINK
ncbi:MAG: DUF1934 family protein [Mycoplasmatales bacterium]|nr:DUF1934 family protein [Mycoplasmatales bacterium]